MSAARKKALRKLAKRRGQDRIGSEIKRQKSHGKKQSQAEAIALSKARRGKLGTAAKRVAPRQRRS